MRKQLGRVVSAKLAEMVNAVPRTAMGNIFRSFTKANKAKVDFDSVWREARSIRRRDGRIVEDIWWGFIWRLKNELGYSFGMALESAPEAAPQVLNKNAGCLQ